MKKKFSFNHLLMLALIVLGLSAGCTKTVDPDAADALVGTWKYGSVCNPSTLNTTTGTLTVTKKNATTVVFKVGSQSIDVTVSGSTFSGSLVESGLRLSLSGTVSGNSMSYVENVTNAAGASVASCTNTATK